MERGDAGKNKWVNVQIYAQSNNPKQWLRQTRKPTSKWVKSTWENEGTRGRMDPHLCVLHQTHQEELPWLSHIGIAHVLTSFRLQETQTHLHWWWTFKTSTGKQDRKGFAGKLENGFCSKAAQSLAYLVTPSVEASVAPFSSASQNGDSTTFWLYLFSSYCYWLTSLCSPVSSPWLSLPHLP